jgi:hypothetical protein
MESFTKKVKQIEQIQRDAARGVFNRPYNLHNPSSASELINKIQWPSLQLLRVWAVVTLMYKVVNFLIAVPVIYHPTIATVRSTRRSLSIKFISIQCRINVYQHSLFPRNVNTWTIIPDSCVTIENLEAFKSSIQLVLVVPSYV